MYGPHLGDPPWPPVSSGRPTQAAGVMCQGNLSQGTNHSPLSPAVGGGGDFPSVKDRLAVHSIMAGRWPKWLADGHFQSTKISSPVQTPGLVQTGSRPWTGSLPMGDRKDVCGLVSHFKGRPMWPAPAPNFNLWGKVPQRLTISRAQYWMVNSKT